MVSHEPAPLDTPAPAKFELLAPSAWWFMLRKCYPMPIAYSPELSGKRILVLFPDYSAPKATERFADAGGALNVLARILWMVRSTARSQHVRMYRDHCANPRSPEYMADVVRGFATNVGADRLTLVADPSLEAVAASALWANETVRRAGWLRHAKAEEFDVYRADAVVVIQPDPLGMGLGRLERALLGRYPHQTFVLNGRRRLYRLDRSIARTLNRRRFLAETRVVEAFLSYALWPIALVLAAKDAIVKPKNS
jgi:hypothetical protein